MKRLGLAALALVATSAWAGEFLLGTLGVYDGGVVTNRTNGYVNYSCPPSDGGLGCFVVSPQTKITVQPDDAVYFITDVPTTSATRGLFIAGGEKFPTSINGNRTGTAYANNSDGGTVGVAVTYTGGWVTMTSTDGGPRNVKVFARTGTE